MKRSNVVDGDKLLASVRAKRNQDRSRQWQLTENNPDYTKQEAVERLTSIGSALYSIGCEEIGASGTRHIHAYVVYKNAIELVSLKKLFPRGHFEHCRGNIRSNVEYITKDDSEPFEVGELPYVVSNEGKNDVSSDIVALMMGGMSILSILSRYPIYSDYIVRNFRNLRELERSLPIYHNK